jgi:hypothetical protein
MRPLVQKVPRKISIFAERPGRARDFRLPAVQHDGSREILTARSFEELEAMRGTWESVELPTHEHELDFLLTRLRSRPTVVRPHTTIIVRDGHPVANALGWVEEASLECRFGYWAMYRPLLRLLVVRPSVVFQEETESVATALVKSLLACLSRGEAEAVCLYRVRTDSALYAAARQMPSFLCREWLVPNELRWTLDLPSSLESFLESRSRHARGELRNLDRRLTRKYGKRLRVSVLRSPGDQVQLSADLEHVAAKTYQRGLGIGFVGSEELRRTMKLALDRGWLRAYVLYLDDEPIAYRTGFVYKRTFFGSSTGFDPSYAHDRVGNFLLVRVIEDLCRDEVVEVLDYGRGDEQYKRRFSTSASQEADLIIFAPTVRAVRINMARSGILFAARAGQGLLRRAGLLMPLRRRWRNKLRKSMLG